MKPLMVLLTASVLIAFFSKLLQNRCNFSFSARAGLSAMLIFTGAAHFIFTKGMAMMIPSFIPLKTELVYFTGVVEILAAIGLLVPATRIMTGWLLILFFVMVLGANIHAAFHNINYQKANFQGDGPAYLWFRVPLQIFFMLWVYVSTIEPTMLEK